MKQRSYLTLLGSYDPALSESGDSGALSEKPGESGGTGGRSEAFW